MNPHVHHRAHKGPDQSSPRPPSHCLNKLHFNIIPRPDQSMLQLQKVMSVDTPRGCMEGEEL